MPWPAARCRSPAVLPRRVREGVYAIHSGLYLRKWTVGLACDVMLDTLSSLYSTVYMRHWYRLMGARIGRDTEVATNFSGRFDTIEIGERCFVADEVVIGDEDIRRGWMTVRGVRVGAQVFLGNAAEIGAQEVAGQLAGGRREGAGNAPDYLLDQRKTGGGNFAEHAGSLRKRSGASGARDYTCGRS